MTRAFLRHLFAIGLIVGIALVAYSNTFYVPFQFDDRPNITENPDIQVKVMTWDQLERMVKNIYKGNIRFFPISLLHLIITLEHSTYSDIIW